MIGVLSNIRSPLSTVSTVKLENLAFRICFTEIVSFHCTTDFVLARVFAIKNKKLGVKNKKLNTLFAFANTQNIGGGYSRVHI